MHDTTMKQFWNEEFKRNKDPWTEPDEVLVKEVEGIKPGTVIDIGSGEGANAVYLARKGWQVTAFDYAAEGIKTVEKMAASKNVELKTIVGDILDYQFKESYDLVLVAHLHLGPDERPLMLANTAKALAPGGTLIFIGVEPYEGMDASYKDQFAPTDEIAGIIGKIAGIKIEKAETIHRVISYPGGSEEVDSILIRATRI
ncbi:methyltransferase domain-containing protein [candidate division WOR-3 bacterium]|uniref:Methyltransferase domain-containing protein n=1 Tax=candidate division WOR-3 bacterium TaxID=2052148 RepID=A0A9D5KAA0_UNCW3|nr:methyltransferase domain-containing protein [candidate division WOR-3 bacterium]MBD3365147.1 methyltransferase domain-containing protein [candidate division WOR-3 bacterium]